MAMDNSITEYDMNYENQPAAKDTSAGWKIKAFFTGLMFAVWEI